MEFAFDPKWLQDQNSVRVWDQKGHCHSSDTIEIFAICHEISINTSQSSQICAKLILKRLEKNVEIVKICFAIKLNFVLQKCPCFTFLVFWLCEGG